jgi:hypothetical protein
MALLSVPEPTLSEGIMIKLAREIAMDIQPLDAILKDNGLDQDTWNVIQNNTRFRMLLETETSAWGSALNTQERLRLKSAAALEEWLPELFTRMNDRAESLNAKVEAGKLISRWAGVGMGGTQGVEGSEKFSVTINLGADNQIKIEKDLPYKVIDHEED